LYFVVATMFMVN